MAEGTESGGAGGDALREIADQLEGLARRARVAATEGLEPAESRRVEQEAERTIADAVRRLRDEADRVVAEAARVLERSVPVDSQRVGAGIAEAVGQRVAERLQDELERHRDSLRAAAADAEREARERILAATESACERIEAVDHAQERVARALSRVSPRPGGEAGDEAPGS